MVKQQIRTIKEKNIIIDRIINVMIKKNNFLICGHKNPDEDCIASMVAFALLLAKFDKFSMIYIGKNLPRNLQYLANICKYNSIKLLHEHSIIKNTIESIIFCDTPKKSMLNINNKISSFLNDKKVIKIEIDHHIGGDSEYIGDPEYRLVTSASSTSELIGFLALKLKNKKNILKKFLIADPFTRNLVLAIITGIVSDTHQGQFLKSKREKRFYNIFSQMYNSILMKMTVKENNFNTMEEVFKELQHLSKKEEECYKHIIKNQNFSNIIGYTILNKIDMQYLYKRFDQETIINVSKAIANNLAEQSGKLSLVCYYDENKSHPLIQFRMRRSHNFKNFDLRKVLEIFDIKNGGGHEGAIGFRIPIDHAGNINKYVTMLISRLELELDKK
jgi:nanoRNase/pAp phosphatase (c-di-AMP/oligoRNAs hydrolase)